MTLDLTCRLWSASCIIFTFTVVISVELGYIGFNTRFFILNLSLYLFLYICRFKAMCCLDLFRSGSLQDTRNSISFLGRYYWPSPSSFYLRVAIIQGTRSAEFQIYGWARLAINLDRLIGLSESSLLGWFLQVSLIVIIKGRPPIEVPLIVIINQVTAWSSLPH